MEHVVSVARYAGLDLDSTQMAQFAIFAEWLVEEGARAGAIGPGEVSRLERRHLADSLLFASLLPIETADVWDLGTGVGLPGIPLAIALPDVAFRLVDRSGRRIDLLRRVVRILDLENCEVVLGDVEGLTGSTDVIVARASLPPPELRRVSLDLLRPGGVILAAGSWQRRPDYPGWETVEIPADVLDQSVWLLMMRRT